MKRRAGVSLAGLTTFSTGGEAHSLVEIEYPEDLVELSPLPGGFFILGGGSNVLAPEAGLDATIVKVALHGVEFEDLGERVRVVLGAGESWDAFVSEAAARGLWGVENLAGIPGTVGGAVVQNIGAYGAELSESFEYAEVLDLERGVPRRIGRAEAAFGYRESAFKRARALLITKVAFILPKRGVPNLAYRDLATAKDRGDDLGSPALIAEVVRSIRAGKFPDLTREGTAGSFFKNPVVPSELADSLTRRYPDVPQFPQADGRVKLSLAWLLDHALALKGFSMG
ncbi:MAG: FAD-binding protein, partial [Minisyncoccia bacterium]